MFIFSKRIYNISWSFLCVINTLLFFFLWSCPKKKLFFSSKKSHSCPKIDMKKQKKKEDKSLAILSFFYGREGMPFRLRLCFPARQSHIGSCSSNSDEARESNSARMIRHNQTEQLFGRLRTELCSPHFDFDSCSGNVGQTEMQRWCFYRAEDRAKHAASTTKSTAALDSSVFCGNLSKSRGTDSTRMSRLYLSTQRHISIYAKNPTNTCNLEEEDSSMMMKKKQTQTI